MRYILMLVVFLLVACAVVYVAAGRATAPVIQVLQPGKLVGQDATLDITIEAPKSAFKSIDIKLEQKGRTVPLFSSASPAGATVKQEGPDKIRITRPIGRRAIP